MKRIVPVFLAVCMIITVFSGCSLFSAKGGSDKEFSGEGLTITLTDSFRIAEVEGYTLCYDSFDVGVFALKETFSDYPTLEGLTLDDYKGYVLEANKDKSPKEDASFDGLTVLKYEYRVEAKKANFTYFVSLYKARDAFWLVQFACKSSVYAEYEPYFVKWAKSVRI